MLKGCVVGTKKRVLTLRKVKLTLVLQLILGKVLSCRNTGLCVGVAIPHRSPAHSCHCSGVELALGVSH